MEKINQQISSKKSISEANPFITSNSKLFKVGAWVDYDIQSSVDETYNPRNLKDIKKKITASDIAVVDFLRDNEINI